MFLHTFMITVESLPIYVVVEWIGLTRAAELGVNNFTLAGTAVFLWSHDPLLEHPLFLVNGKK